MTRVYPPGQRILGLLLAIPPLVAVSRFPITPALTTALALGWLLALLAVPSLWLLLLPTLVVVLDLTPWSGRFLYNELDLMMWLTIAAGLLRADFPAPALGRYWLQPGILFSAGFVVVALAGYRAWETIALPPLASSDNPYFLPAYQYKVAKGLFWGAALAPLLLHHLDRDRERTLDRLWFGAASASLALLAVILWERGVWAAATDSPASAWQAFANLATHYRVIGLFSDMHTGGEALDALIMLFLVLTGFGTAYAGSRGIRFLCGLAFPALTYVTLVGFTRATYFAFALTVSLCVGLELLRQQRRLSLHRRHAVTAAAVLPLFLCMSYGTALWLGEQYLPAVTAAEGIVALAFLYRLPGLGLTPRFLFLLLWLSLPWLFVTGLTTTALGERMETVQRDLQTRTEHWKRVIDLGLANPAERFLGAGAGRFPEHYRSAAPAQHTKLGDFAVLDDGERYLRLTGGEDLILYQRIQIQDDVLDLSLDLRAPAGGRLSVGLCARNILDTGWYGGRCDSRIINLPPGEDFQVRHLSLERPEESWQGVARQWPRSLQLRALDTGKPIDLRLVRANAGLEAPIANPRFQSGTDRWFFTTDFAHLPFHIKNIWLQFWFDHGWLGLLSMLGLTILLPLRALRAATEARLIPMGAAAVLSLGALGCFGTPLDSARVAWLFYLLVFAAACCQDSREIHAGKP